MGSTKLEFQPASIPDWEAEDAMFEHLGDGLENADGAQGKKILDANDLRLEEMDQCNLRDYNAKRPTPLGLEIPADSRDFDFYQIAVPVTIITPHDRLVRMALKLEFQADGDSEAIAYDLFPTARWDAKDVNLGDFSVDVAKALTFVPGAGKVLADCLGLKLDIPLKWTCKHLSIQTSNRMSNPVRWNVKDEQIGGGFTAYAIVRAPRDTRVTIAASMECEVRRTVAQKILRARGETPPVTPRSYTLGKRA